MSEIENIKKKMIERMEADIGYAKNKNTWPKTPLKATDGTIDDLVQQYDLLVVDVWAQWCGPCRMFGPIIEDMAKSMHGKVVFAKLNSDENPATSMKYHIMSIPTILLFKNGKLVDQTAGALPSDMLQDWIEKHL